MHMSNDRIHNCAHRHTIIQMLAEQPFRSAATARMLVPDSMSRIMRAQQAFLHHGSVDETSNVNGRDERSNLKVVEHLRHRTCITMPNLIALALATRSDTAAMRYTFGRFQCHILAVTR